MKRILSGVEVPLVDEGFKEGFLVVEAIVVLRCICVVSADGGGGKRGLRKLMSPLKHRRTRSGEINISDRNRTVGRTFTSLTTARSRDKMEDSMPYLSWQPTLGRNSQFVNLTAEQREELGGIEYRALKTLAKILIGYFVGDRG